MAPTMADSMLIHVTGAKGLLGRSVVDALTPLGEVHGTDVEEMDITDGKEVMAALGERPPQVLVHLAALKGNQPSRERPMDFFRVNTAGTVNLLEACRELKVGHFVFISSITVHGPSADPVEESSPWAPLHPYAGSKAAAEAMVRTYSSAYGIAATVFRPNFIVGPIAAPQPYADNIVYDFIEAVQSTGVIELAGDGHYQREWLHPRDVASAVALAAASSPEGYETYVLSGNRVTMLELARCIVRKVGDGCIVTNHNRSGFSLVSSSEKARRELRWSPKVDLDSLVAEIWNEYWSRSRTTGSRHHRD